MRPFVTCELSGRCGNQIWQIAATIATALKHNVDYLIPNTAGVDEVYIKTLPLFEPSKHIIRRVYHDNEFRYQPISFEQNMQLKGYYQAWQHCEQYLPQIIDILNLPYNKKAGIVGIHIRRGDYLQLKDKHPDLGTYYDKCMQYFMAKGFYNFKIFSDDIAWCKHNIRCMGAMIRFSENNTPLQDLIELANCEHQIIAASTFSIWAGALNRNPDKIVLRPSFFLGATHKKLYRNVYQKNWIEIK